MAARVDADEVKEILDTSVSGDLTAFIAAADQLVDEIAAVGTLGAAALKEIARWLAAHFVAIRDQRSAADKVGDSSHTYQGKTAMGLDATTYGQQAKALDTTGTLSDLSKRKASMTYLGGTVNTEGEVKI